MVVMECRNLTVGYGGQAVFKQINTSFSAGNIYAILGTNGCGKAILLRTLASGNQLEQTTGYEIVSMVLFPYWFFWTTFCT